MNQPRCESGRERRDRNNQYETGQLFVMRYDQRRVSKPAGPAEAKPKDRREKAGCCSPNERQGCKPHQPDASAYLSCESGLPLALHWSRYRRFR